MDTVVASRPWRHYAASITLFFVILVAGLYYVKWHPYYLRSFVAASQGSIGGSILTGGAKDVPAPSWDAAWGYAWAYGKAIWQAMVLGLLLGSGVQAAFPRQWIARAFGRLGFGCVAAGGLAAVPGMMCTCCCAPVVVGLRKAKSSVGSALAFWLANPLLNPATMIFTGFVLGWHWVALRLVFALLVVFGVAYLAEVLFAGEPAVEAAAADVAAEDEPSGGFFVRWAAELWRLSIRLLPEYVVIVLVLGAVRAWLFPAMPGAVGNDALWMIGLAIAGTAFVIPTAGEVPIVQSLMALGLGAGPAAALMVTLPAVSVPAAVMVSKVFPQRVVWFVAGCVALSGIIAGFAAVGLGF
ncbi:MAG TPA: permease [Alphaproteobacteria bacterium]|nr:permease [Alphaproteobacteria bacterium]